MDIHAVYAVFMRHFRMKRMNSFKKMFNVGAETKILDVGGTPFIWTIMKKKPQVVLLNVTQPEKKHDGFLYITADGCNLPFKTNSFDIVFSNSVIEHLGNMENVKNFVSEIVRVGKRYCIQTPNKYFLVEPHFITPFIHFLPKRIQKTLLRNFTVWGLITRPGKEIRDSFLNGIHLFGENDLRRILPDAHIMKEKFMGMTKSLLICRP